MWNRNEQRDSEPSTDRSAASSFSPSPPPSPSRPSASAATKNAGPAAVIGPSISIRGDLTGEEDLVIEGQVEGEVMLEKHRVEVGKGGRVKADIHAKTIHVHGQVDGNLAGDEEVVIHASGRVAGNIAAPRVTLEDGCNFRGSVDMSPRKKESPAVAQAEKRPASSAPASSTPSAPARQPLKAGA